VNNVLVSLEDDMLQCNTCLLFINCMASKNLDAIWDRLYSELGGPKKRSKAPASELVQALVEKSKTKW